MSGRAQAAPRRPLRPAPFQGHPGTGNARKSAPERLRENSPGGTRCRAAREPAVSSPKNRRVSSRPTGRDEPPRLRFLVYTRGRSLFEAAPQRIRRKLRFVLAGHPPWDTAARLIPAGQIGAPGLSIGRQPPDRVLRIRQQKWRARGGTPELGTGRSPVPTPAKSCPGSSKPPAGYQM